MRSPKKIVLVAIALAVLIVLAIAFGNRELRETARPLVATPRVPVAIAHSAVAPVRQTEVVTALVPEEVEELVGNASGLPVSLVGTIVRANASESIGTIRYVKTESAENVGPGTDILKLAVVVRIERERIIVRNLVSKGLEYIRIGKFDSSKAASPSAVAQAFGHDAELQIERSFVDKVTADLPSFFKDARAVPVLTPEGTVAGFQILDIVPGSAYEKLGLKSGDSIRAVNGRNITSVQDALELYSQLRESSMVQLKIGRGGKDGNFTYLIR